MASSEVSEALRFKKVTVDFDGAIHHYRIVPNYTFASLLIDSAKHWMVDEDDYELQDEDGCTWPAAGVVVEMLLAEKALEDFPQSSDLLVYLKPLKTFGNIQSPRYAIPPPSLASSYSSMGSSYGASSTIFSSSAVAIPKPSSSPLSRSSASNQHQHQRTPSKSDAVRKLIEENRLAPPIVSSPLSSSVSIDRSYLSDSSLSFPDTSSDTLRHLSASSSELRQLANKTDSSMDSINRSTSTEDLYSLLSHPSQNPYGTLKSPLTPPSSISFTAPKPANLDSVPEGFGTILRHQTTLDNSHSSPIASNLSEEQVGRRDIGITAPQTPQAAKLSNFGSIEPVSPSTAHSSPGSRLETPVISSHLLSLPPIQHGYARRGHTHEMAMSDSNRASPSANAEVIESENGSRAKEVSSVGEAVATAGLVAQSGQNGKAPDSARTSAVGIRLRKAYDNVTVNEVLSDPRIQLAPTTHKDVTLEWDSPPKRVLIIKKRQEPGITELLRAMAIWLQEEKGIKVLIEPSVVTELPDLIPFSALLDDPELYPDFVICLGGDGTVLHANTLFQNSMPPVMAFSLGSLGFLTPFRVRKYKQSISGVLNECKVTLRSRLFCIVVKHVDGKETVTRRTVLNEVVIDRGYSPYLSNLECYCDNVPITNIQADGIIISSTTGSTAYSLSAGGSMVHPQMPAILFTPICPHSLSFRPLIFPDSVELKIQVPDDSRSTAWASFDGREQTELHRGDYLIIRVSKWPFVWIRESDGVGDWFKSLADCLHWNDRRKQKPPSASMLASPTLHSSPSPAPSSSNSDSK